MIARRYERNNPIVHVLVNRTRIVIAGTLVALTGCAGTQTIGSAMPVAPNRAYVGRNATGSTNNDVVAAVPNLRQQAVRDRGDAPRNAELQLSLVLRYRNGGQLEHLIAEQGDVLSPMYHHWLTTEQFDATYAPLAADYDRAIASLERGGLTVTQTSGNRTVIDARGSVGQIERYFSTSIHRVAQPGYGTEFVNVQPAYAPHDLKGVLLSVAGLDTVVVMRPFLATVPRNGLKPRVAAKQSQLYGPVSTATDTYGYGPAAFSHAYDLPITHTAPGGQAYDGKGRTTAIVIDADATESDFKAFLAYFHVKRTGPATRRVKIDGGPLPLGGEPQVEATLDSEQILSNAPGTALILYETPGLNGAEVTDAYNRVVFDNLADAVNSSFGGCEAAVGATTVEGMSALAEQGAAKGITFAASSGDAGGDLCANAPASSPYFVGIGGTTLNVTSSGAWATETAWGDTTASGPTGSGGGISSVFALPSWQQGLAGVISGGRNVPDVALDANPLSGAALYIGETGFGPSGATGWNVLFNPIGGTSLACPLFSAAVTEIDQVHNGRAGFADGKLYGIWKSKGYGTAIKPYFHDITVGDNGLYFAGKGYDLVTGIGSIDAWNIAGAL